MNDVFVLLILGVQMISVTLRFVYVLLGISLKGVFDYIDNSHKRSVEELTRRRESVTTYRPNPAALKGSSEAARTIAYARHIGSVEPQLKELDAEIAKARKRPLTFWGTLSLIFATAAVILQWMELSGY